MNKKSDDETLTALERRSRELFDAEVANLDARTRSRLNQARQAALAAAHPDKRAFRWLVPVSSVTALVLIAMVTLQFMRGGESTSGSQATTSVEDMEIIASADELDFLQNDLEFYDWLDSPEAALPESKSS